MTDQFHPRLAIANTCGPEDGRDAISRCNLETMIVLGVGNNVNEVVQQFGIALTFRYFAHLSIGKGDWLRRMRMLW